MEMDWMQLAQDMVQWRSVLNIAMKFLAEIRKKVAKFIDQLSDCHFLKEAYRVVSWSFIS